MKPAAGYEFRGFYVPVHTAEALENWVAQRLVPGDFLCAVLSNDLKEALGRADTANMFNIVAIVGWLYNEAPSRCWGSPEKFEAWAAQIEAMRAGAA